MSIRLFVPEGDVSYGLILDVNADGQGSPANANEFLTLLAEAGFGGVEILEIALMRDWIPDAFSPRYIVGGATLEIFALATPAAVAAALGNLDVNGGDVTPAEDIAIWGARSLLVILLNASDQGEFQAVIATLVGPPHLVTTEDLGPQPDPAALAQTVDTVRAALVAAGFEVMLEPVAVNRPFLPSNALSQVLSADGAMVEVYALAEPDFQGVLDELSSVEPLPLREGIVWVSGSTLVILPASDQAGLVPAVIGALGTPVFVGPEASTGPDHRDAQWRRLRRRTDGSRRRGARRLRLGGRGRRRDRERMRLDGGADLAAAGWRMAPVRARDPHRLRPHGVRTDFSGAGCVGRWRQGNADRFRMDQGILPTGDCSHARYRCPAADCTGAEQSG